MAEIRHLALFSEDPQKLAEFYRDVFGLTITGKGESNSVWITDGHIDIALLHYRRPDQTKGLNHFGFLLGEDEKTDVVEKLKARGIETFYPGPSRPFVEEAATDIDGNRYDLSTARASAHNEVEMLVKPATKAPLST